MIEFVGERAGKVEFVELVAIVGGARGGGEEWDGGVEWNGEWGDWDWECVGDVDVDVDE